jgi:urocanate hydratase
MADNSKKNDGHSLDRRSVLKVLGLGAGAAATGTAAVVSGGPALAAESDAEKMKARYKETDHVKSFYRTNRY